MAGYEHDEKAVHTSAPTATQRITGLTQQINTPIACELCGSTWFYTIHAEQFAGGGYGSAEMRSISGNPVQMRICLCGNPVVPQSQNFGGSRALGSRESFYMSAKDAKTYREKHSLDHVATIAASPAEIEALKKEIKALQETITKMAEIVAKPKLKSKGSPAIEPKIHTIGPK